MPTHRIPRVSLAVELIDLYRRHNEEVVSVDHDPDDPGTYVVVTKTNTTVETRA